MSTKNKEYIVIKKGVCLKGVEEIEKGKTVKLTEAKAACLVGKVRLASEHNAEPKSDGKLAKENDKMSAKLEKLQADNDELTKANAGLTAEIVKLTTPAK